MSMLGIFLIWRHIDTVLSYFQVQTLEDRSDKITPNTAYSV